MASLNEICKALATTIKAGSTSPVYAYDTVGQMTQFPAIMVEPEVADFKMTFGATMTWTIRVYVLCAGTEKSLVIRQLNDMIDGWGDNSIRRIIYEHDDLGLGDGTDAMALEVTGYGGSFEESSIKAVGAIMTVRVLTDPSA